MKASITFLIILILVGGFIVINKEQTPIENEPTSVETESKKDRAPDFTLNDYDGNSQTFSEISEGKIAVVNAWAVWCPFCKKELEDFAQLQNNFGDEIVVIAIDRAESLKKAKGFTDSINVTDKMTFLLDPSDSFYRSIGGFSMPETIFVNAKGEIVLHKRGPIDLAEMTEIINSIK
ncbi:hypothetical protein COB55_01075 [Candidatus Wolfebacteria bacterium]|nr:MAG: hypothetical protein COB55_01075 [Candidatus Wolfebacteria bacterium]